MSKQVSSVIFRGPSLLDGAPIVVVAIISKRNRKTGDMLQTYILRSDINPLEANKTGSDYSICGNCPLRGIATNDPTRKLAEKRACYVQIGQGPLNVFKMLSRNGYPDAVGHAAIAAIGAGRMVRLGTYGDPAAVPSYIWESLLSASKGHTAYSHQSTVAGSSFNPAYTMVSADNEQAARAAWSQGFRTFRVVPNVESIIKGSEVLCPASKEAGARVQCADCRLCGGTAVKAKSIAIPAHGAGSNYVRN